nr:hypothetical protein [uncultured Draconibacterium sp.]
MLHFNKIKTKVLIALVRKFRKLVSLDLFELLIPRDLMIRNLVSSRLLTYKNLRFIIKPQVVDSLLWLASPEAIKKQYQLNQEENLLIHERTFDKNHRGRTHRLSVYEHPNGKFRFKLRLLKQA